MEQLNKKDELGSTIDTLEKCRDVSRGKVASRNHKYLDVASRLFSPTAASRNGRKEKFKGSSANTSPDLSSPPFKDVKFDTFMVEESKYQGTAKKRVSKIIRFAEGRKSVSTFSKSHNQVVQKVGSGKDEVNIEVVKKLGSSLVNIIESDKKEEFENKNEIVLNKVQISRNDAINGLKDSRNVEKNTPRRSSRLAKGNVRREREIKPMVGEEIDSEKGYCNTDIKDRKIANLTDNRKRILNLKDKRMHVSDTDNGKKKSNHLTTTDKSISINSELNESKVVIVEGQEENELTFEIEKGRGKEKENKDGSKNQINENSVDSISDSEKDKSGDWWRDEVEITDQAPTSPPPLHRSSPYLNSPSPLLRTPVTQTVVRSKRTSSLSMSGESFNSDATTASITPVIHRIPRTQQDFITDREGRETINRKKSVDNVKINNDEVSELSDINNKHKKDYVRSRDEEDEQEDEGEGEEGEGGGEGDKGDERKVRFQSPDRSTSVIQNDKDDEDFSNFFISTFSSSVNSSDSEKS